MHFLLIQIIIKRLAFFEKKNELNDCVYLDLEILINDCFKKFNI